MKRFLIGIGTSIVLITTGCTIMLFEMKEYRVVNSFHALEDEIETYTTVVSQKDPLRIELDNDYDTRLIRYEIDDTLEDKVEIEISNIIDHRYSNNRLRIDEHQWLDLPFGNYLDTFIDGLKDKKIYYYDEDLDEIGEVIIRCSSKSKAFIEVRNR